MQSAGQPSRRISRVRESPSRLLLLVAVDAKCWPAVEAHLTCQRITVTFGAAEDQNSGAIHYLLEQSFQSGTFVLVLHYFHILADSMRAAKIHRTDVDVHGVLFADIASQFLNLFWPCCAPHQCLAIRTALRRDL